VKRKVLKNVHVILQCTVFPNILTTRRKVYFQMLCIAAWWKFTTVQRNISRLQSVPSQKVIFVIVAAVRTSNPTLSQARLQTSDL
jgi:hypothetical protein